MNQWTETIERLEAENKRLLAELDKHKWISVEDDLPNNEQMVLILQKGGNQMIAQYSANENWFDDPFEPGCWSYPEHWQPLPSTEGI